MAPANIDVSVLLLFFARPEPFAKVFEQVRKARPARLFLYQDGPREGNATDAENIRKCREIAENIDWECEVHKLYQEKNIGVVVLSNLSTNKKIPATVIGGKMMQELCGN